MENNRFRLVLVIVVMIAVSLACVVNFSGEDPEATLNAMSTSIVETATAAAVEGGGSGGAVKTAQAEATQRSQELQITQNALQVDQSEQQIAQSTVAAPILGELPIYGVDSQNGQLGWAHDPVTLDIDGYQQNAFANDYMQVIAADFVMAADITWNTQFGSSACGFMFRSDGNQNKPNQYTVIISRAGLGHAVFIALADGEPANFKDFYARDEDKSFDFHNDATNRLAIVARGPIIEIYTNGTKIGEVDTTQPPSQPMQPPMPSIPINMDDITAKNRYEDEMEEYEEQVQEMQEMFSTASMNFEQKDAIYEQGFLGMIALSESGHTVCSFSDAWLWLITGE